jgi:hypothetical protein
MRSRFLAFVIRNSESSVDLVTLAAILVAGVSLAASALLYDSLAMTFRFGCALLVPLAAIAFPEVLDAMFRRSRSGFSHGGEGPTPPLIIRVGAWLLLIVTIVAHHALALARD